MRIVAAPAARSAGWVLLADATMTTAGRASRSELSSSGWLIACCKALLLSPIIIVIIHSLTALAEETGWRGFLWPLMRRRWSFLVSTLVIGAVWWTYHVPLIILGWYGSPRGLPAFTVAIIGITLFIGVITDRSRAVWPSVIAHGAWNALVVSGFVVAAVPGNASLAVFAGSTFWVGEFGWLAAIASLVTGALATCWHLSRPMPNPLTPAAPQPEQAKALMPAAPQPEQAKAHSSLGG